MQQDDRKNEAGRARERKNGRLAKRIM